MRHYYSLGSLLLIGGALLPGRIARAQSRPPADSVVLAATVGQLHARYLEAQKTETALNNGVEYIPVMPPNVLGHPFLDGRDPLPGAVTYEGYQFGGLSLLYDVQQDGVVLANLGGPLRIKLIGEKLTAFEVGGRRFVRVQGGAVGPVPTGFYELLFDDAATAVQLLARHTKMLERKGGTEFRQEFRPDTKYYLRTSQGYQPVSKASAVIATWPAKKKELKEFVRSHQLKFRKPERAASLTALTRYYNSLLQADAARR